MTLAPCPHCQRHLRVDEARCPFCGGAVAGTLHARRPPSTTGLSRAAILALGASMTVSGTVGPLLAPGCGDSDDDDGEARPGDAGSDGGAGDAGSRDAGASDAGRVVPVYGAPVSPDAGGAPDAAVAPDAGQNVAVYGAPVTPVDRDAGNIVPLYGASVYPAREP